MPDNITFNEIPNTRIPGVYAEFNLLAGRRLIPQNEQPVLLIAQGSGVAGMPVNQLIDVYDADQLGAIAGFGSLVHRMARALQTVNHYLNVQAILFDDAAWPAAALSVAVDDADVATAAGNAEIRINKDVVRVDVAKDDTGADVKAALVAAINADKNLPVTAAVDGGTTDLVLTAKTKGWVGSLIKVQGSCSATGIDMAVAKNTPLVTVSTKPDAADMDALLAKVAAAGHKVLVVPYATADAIASVKTHLDFVSSGVEKRGARAVFFASSRGDIAAGKVLTAGNNHWRTMIGYSRANRAWEPELAAAAAAVVAAQQDPGLPVNDLPLTGQDIPDLEDRLLRSEEEDMLRHGLTPFKVGPGNVLQFVRAITTYTTTENGVADDSLLDFTKPGAADYVRKACVERIQLLFARVKRSPSVLRKIRSELLAVLKRLEELEIIEDVDRWKDDLVVMADPNDNYRAIARIPAAIIPGLHVVAEMIDLL